MKPRAWYRFQNQVADPAVVDIHVTDIIGDWIDELINEFWGMKATLTAKAFIDQLSKLDQAVKTIRVHINSPGGDVFAAVTIANALRDQQLSKGRSVETIVDGLAASAASIIAMAGKTVVMADNAMMMIHKPLTGLWGNATSLRAAATELDAIELHQIVSTYKWHSKLEDAEILALLTGKDGVDGTWMGADEAIANGFATSKIDGLQAAATIDHRVIGGLNVPEKFKARIAAWTKQPEPVATPAAAGDIIAAVDAAGLPTALAGELLAAALPMDQVTARVAGAKAKKAAAETRAREIRALCDAVKFPELAAGYVDGAMTVDSVRVHLTTITAKRDTAAIDTSLPAGGHDSKAKSVIDVQAIYRERNQAPAV